MVADTLVWSDAIIMLSYFRAEVYYREILFVLWKKKERIEANFIIQDNDVVKTLHFEKEKHHCKWFGHSKQER